jgi:hypothetical protein
MSATQEQPLKPPSIFARAGALIALEAARANVGRLQRMTGERAVAGVAAEASDEAAEAHKQAELLRLFETFFAADESEHFGPVKTTHKSRYGDNSSLGRRRYVIGPGSRFRLEHNQNVIDGVTEESYVMRIMPHKADEYQSDDSLLGAPNVVARYETPKEGQPLDETGRALLNVSLAAAQELTQIPIVTA